MQVKRDLQIGRTNQTNEMYPSLEERRKFTQHFMCFYVYHLPYILASGYALMLLYTYSQRIKLNKSRFYRHIMSEIVFI